MFNCYKSVPSLCLSKSNVFPNNPPSSFHHCLFHVLVNSLLLFFFVEKIEGWMTFFCREQEPPEHSSHSGRYYGFECSDFLRWNISEELLIHLYLPACYFPGHDSDSVQQTLLINSIMFHKHGIKHSGVYRYRKILYHRNYIYLFIILFIWIVIPFIFHL